VVHYIDSTLLTGRKLCKLFFVHEFLCIISFDRSIIRPATSDDVESVNDSFWRIAPGGSGVDCFLASSKSVILQDFRVRFFLCGSNVANCIPEQELH